MTRFLLRYSHVLILLAFSWMLVSCFPEYSEKDDDGPVFEGDVLRFDVTLDQMGGIGTRAGLTEAYLNSIENYVDPEKFRVLVFGGTEDEFLFESKSRWIKQLDPDPTHSTWSVAIPLYSYGNDREYEGLWENIRDRLTKESFKIAILANRPEVDWFPEMTGNTDQMNTATQFDNSGPHWGKVNSAAYTGTDKKSKTVFDLHHSQYDPIYEYKGEEKTRWGTGMENNVYSIIMESGQVGTGKTESRPFLSATSSWVQFGNSDEKGRYFAYAADYPGYEKSPTDNSIIRDSVVSGKNAITKYYKGEGWGKNRDARGWNFRKTRIPDKSYPIPMYGIQKFDALSNWKKGTTISLDRTEDKPISLLRSVVKLELVIPDGYEPTDVVLFYSNIYARCEPMDVWTPTNEIWADSNGDHTLDGICDEMEAVQALGLMTENGGNYDTADAGTNRSNFDRYQLKIARLYGRWWESGKWGYTGNIYDSLYWYKNTYRDESKRAFPRIFNPCIQRNTAVYVEKTYTDGNGHHYVVYTGERNINDPSQLYRIGNTGSGNPTLLYWCVIYDGQGNHSFLGDGENSITYSFPVADYDIADTYNVSREGRIVQLDKSPWYIMPANSERAQGATNGTSWDANGTGMGEYLMRVQGQTVGTYRQNDGHNDDGKPYTKKDWPIPLIRNHVYKITLSATKSGEDLSFTPRLEEMHTPDICFKK